LFIASSVDLVIAQCKAGVVGSFPALNARPQEELRHWLQYITEALAEHDRQNPDLPSAPFAVNQIVHRSNARLEQDMAICAEYRVPIVISSLGARAEINDAVHAWGGIVLHDVINNRFARSAIDKGADGLIAIAAGAGGHAGAQSPFALLQEIREWFDGPLLLGGAIASGRAILAAQTAGADLAYVGSAFLTTTEANVADAYKEMVVASSAQDIVYTNAISGVWANYLRPSLERAGLDPDDLPRGNATGLSVDKHRHLGQGPKAWKDIWGCGQGIGTLRGLTSTSQLVARLQGEYAQARDDVLALLQAPPTSLVVRN